jgi:DNA-binding NarL/FixJ family response regulator
MQPIRVLVADDHAMMRGALRALLEAEPGLVVAGEAASGEEALEQTLRVRPDVVVMDLSMPGAGGLDATRRIAATSGARVLVLSICPDEEGMLPALHAGASGYLCKTAPPDALIRAIRAVARGEVVLSPSGVRALVRAVAPTRSSPRMTKAVPPGGSPGHPHRRRRRGEASPHVSTPVPDARVTPA